jgi:hypothetical protein
MAFIFKKGLEYLWFFIFYHYNLAIPPSQLSKQRGIEWTKPGENEECCLTLNDEVLTL